MNFKVLDDSGNEIPLKLIKSFCDNKTKINYIIYKDIADDKIYASRYHLDNNKYVLDPIENDTEWDMIDDVLSSLEKCEDNE